MITLDLQRASPGQLVTLFELDVTPLGGDILYFTSSSEASAEVSWNGNVFTPIEIEAEGFDYSAQSAFPTPKLRLGNVTNLATSLVLTYNDLIGSQVRRIRTFSQYLDDGETPDPLQIFPIDVYNVEQKTAHTRKEIEWTLSAAIDQEGAMLPGEMLIRDYCSRVFRHYDARSGTTSYKNATCRYAGPLVKLDGTSTSNPSEDACPKTLQGCKDRFGTSAGLPFKGLPGLGRFR